MAPHPLPPYFLLAVLLHGLILAAWPGRPRPHPLLAPPPLQVELTPAHPLVPARLQSAANPAPRAEHAPPPKRSVAGPGRSAPPTPASTPAEVSPGAASPASAHVLVETVRQQIQAESRRQVVSFAPPAPDPERSVSPLARAMTRPGARERMLAGGILQVTTAAGTTYCLQMPAHATTGGVGEALAVPATCP